MLRFKRIIRGARWEAESRGGWLDSGRKRSLAAGKSSGKQRKSEAASPSLVTGFQLGLSFFRKGRTSEIGFLIPSGSSLYRLIFQIR